MDNDNKKERIVGLLGTLLVHGVLFFLLWFLFIRASEPQAESGVPVLLGAELLAQGDGDRYEMTEVDVQPVPQEISAQPENNFSQVGEEIISQDMEETVAIEPKKVEEKAKEESPKQPAQPTPEQPKEKTEAELRAEAERAAAEAAAGRGAESAAAAAAAASCLALRPRRSGRLRPDLIRHPCSFEIFPCAHLGSDSSHIDSNEQQRIARSGTGRAESLPEQVPPTRSS